MQLLHAPGTIALAALITLEEIGAPYTPVRLDFSKSEQRDADYLALNPKGRVPTLVTSLGTLTETPAILTYLATSFPAAGLLPADPFAAAQAQEMMSYLASTVHVSHAHRVRGSRWSDDPATIENLKLKVAQNMTEHFAYLELQIDSPWVLGKTYSIADPYLFTVSCWLKNDGVDRRNFPAVEAHAAAMEARPAVQRALALQV